MVGRPPTAAYKETKTQQAVAGVGGVHTTAWMPEVEQRRSSCRVPFEFEGQHNPGRGKEPCFVRATKEPRVRGLPSCCPPREVTRKLQRKLCAKAKQETANCYVLEVEYAGAISPVATET